MQVPRNGKERPTVTITQACDMFCERCGKSVGPTAAYCRHCVLTDLRSIKCEKDAWDRRSRRRQREWRRVAGGLRRGSHDVLEVLYRTVDGGDPGGKSRDELVAWLSAMPDEASTRERILAVTKFLEPSASGSTSSRTVYHARRQAERGRLLSLGKVVLVGDDGRQRNTLDPADPKWDELVYQVGACGSTFRDIANETSLSLHRLAALNAEVFRSPGRSGAVQQRSSSGSRPGAAAAAAIATGRSPKHQHGCMGTSAAGACNALVQPSCFHSHPQQGSDCLFCCQPLVLKPGPRQPKHRKRNGATGSRCSFVLCASASSPLSTLGCVLGGACTKFSRVLGSYFQY